jgi:hypothetical protein
VSEDDEQGGSEGHGPGEPPEGPEGHDAPANHEGGDEHGHDEGHGEHEEHDERPPLPPDATLLQRFRYHARPSIALGIVVVATLGSIMSYRASLAEQDSARSEHLASQEEIQRESALSTDNQLVDQDVGVFGRLQEHLLLSQQLRRQAGAESGAAAHALLVQASQEVALARAEQTFMQGAGLNAAGSVPRYEARLARQQAIASDQDLERLVPEALAKQANSVHLRSVKLIGLAAMFIVALFFLTLAEANIGGLRRTFVVVGVIVAVLAIIGGGIV